MTVLGWGPNRRSGDPGGPEQGIASVATAARHRPLPSGRAVVGAFLVAAAATLVLTAWLASTGSHGRRWVVAARHLAPGARIGPADLHTETMTLPQGTAAGAFAGPERLLGRTLSSPLAPGELVQQSALVPVGRQPSLRPVTVSITPADATDLSVGALVDVLQTTGSGRSAQTSVVLRGARVIAETQPGSSLIASSSGTGVTLGVASLAEVEAVIHAERTSSVSVVVGEPSDGTGLGPPPSRPGQGTER